MVDLLKTHTNTEQANSLADYLPNGPVFEAKKVPETNLRRLLEGMAILLQDAEQKINLVSDQYDIRTTTEFIEEWEGFVGIPDDCFIVADTLEERRANVLLKLTAMGVQTEAEFEALGDLLGINIDVIPGGVHGIFPMTFPIMFFDSPKEARFTLIVDYEIAGNYSFPYIFPLLFDTQAVTALKCIFGKLKPANVQLIFRRADFFEKYMIAKNSLLWSRYGSIDIGTTAKDSSGNDNNGVYSGTFTLYEDGLIPTSTDTSVLLGSDGIVNYGNVSDLTNLGTTGYISKITEEY